MQYSVNNFVKILMVEINKFSHCMKITLCLCHVNALSAKSQIVLCSAENMISTFSKQQSVLHIKDLLRLQTEITDRWEIQKREFEKRETYFSTICISTPFLAHDIQASESSGEKKIAATEK